METFLIDVPVPSMGATVNELTVIDLLVAPGAKITKGQKIAEMESDKSIFDFEAPCDGTVVGVQGRAGDILPSGAPFLRIETADRSLKHLQVKESGVRSQESGKAARSVTPMTAAAPAPTPASEIRNPVDAAGHEAGPGGRARSRHPYGHPGHRSRRTRLR
jgi:pyruvate/2-oxoglutarate dehydrogenase complex dihydrolipoamide acyltransferase (E2) component